MVGFMYDVIDILSHSFIAMSGYVLRRFPRSTRNDYYMVGCKGQIIYAMT